MEHEGGGEEDLDRGDGAHNESEPLVQPQPPALNQASRHTDVILTLFKIIFCSLGVWGHTAWNYIPRVLFITICAVQAVIQFSFDIGCPYFAFHQNDNQTQGQQFLKTRDMCFTVFSLAAVLSYAIFLLCVIVSKNNDSALVSPSLTLAEDVDRTEIVLLFLASVVIVASFSSATVLYVKFHLNLIQDRQDSARHALIIATAVVVFLAHWASVNTCHVFAISSLTLGTLAEDAFRLIKNVRNGTLDPTLDPTLDDVIKIHEDLCTVVFNTVSAYSVWFVAHWFTYGAGIVVDIILISKEFLTDHNPTPVYKAYICILLVCFLYAFTLPCFCAARITSKCAGVYEKINCTRSGEWDEGHPFKDRRNISLFVSYAKDRRCGFKVGRITFNTSLAWLSFFFGLTALLFHFF